MIVDNSTYVVCMYQEVIDFTGAETFAKEPMLAKLFRELKVTPMLYNNKSSLVFVAWL